MSHWDFSRSAVGRADAAHSPADDAGDADGAGDAAFGDDGYDADGGDEEDSFQADGLGDQDLTPYPITYERGRIEPVPSRPAAAAYEPDEGYEPWPPAPEPYTDGDPWVRAPVPQAPAPGRPRPWPDDQWQDGQWQDGQWQDTPSPDGRFQDGRPWPPPLPRRRPGRGALIAAGIALAAVIGAIAVLLSGGHPGSAAATATRPAAATSAAASASSAATSAAAASAAGTSASASSVPSGPPLTLAQATAVLAGYTTTNNRANAQRRGQLLATVETGSSFAIDAEQYLMRRAAGMAPYPAFGPASAAYYIPRSEPAAGPRWFAVRVANAFASSPAKVSSVEYLLFLQATPGAPWLNAIEPYLLPGASAPRIAIGADGLATAVAATAASLAVSPGRLPAVTASSFGGSGPVAIPAGVADSGDARSWRAKAPGLTITDMHAPATAGQAFALRTADGGALVFYTVAATMTITGPTGTAFRLSVPGLYSPARLLHRAVLQFRDQFAAYDPPGSGTPRVLADYSGITRRM